MEVKDIRNHILALHPYDFEIALTFFYDETNNIKKLHLKKGGFNVDYEANFVLGGYVYEGQRPDVSHIFDGIPLQSNISEVKFKYIAHGDFDDCLKSQALNTFLRNVSATSLYLHFSSLNLFYYSIVDIVDSIVTVEAMIFTNKLKNDLYVACKTHISQIVPLFIKYTYPNVPKGSVQAFANELIAIIEQSLGDPDLEWSIRLIRDLLQAASGKGELPFITDEEDHILIHGLLPLYMNPIISFLHSTHFFDNEEEIKNKLDENKLTYEGVELKNYSFLDSKVDPLIQACDVTIGLLGKFFKFINTRSHEKILSEVENMSALQLENLDLILDLLSRSLAFNQAFLHSVDGGEERSKVGVLGQLRKKPL